MMMQKVLTVPLRVMMSTLSLWMVLQLTFLVVLLLLSVVLVVQPAVLVLLLLPWVVFLLASSLAVRAAVLLVVVGLTVRQVFPRQHFLQHVTGVVLFVESGLPYDRMEFGQQRHAGFLLPSARRSHGFRVLPRLLSELVLVRI
jgi:hypothetical protein